MRKQQQIWHDEHTNKGTLPGMANVKPNSGVMFFTDWLKEHDIVLSGKAVDIGAGQYIHINVENVDEFYEDLLVKGLQSLSKPQDFPWGHREFVLRDPDGYKLVFFTELDNKGMRNE